MIVLLEEPEAWSLMLLVSAVAADNAGLSPEGKEAIRRWRSDHREGTETMASLTDAMNRSMNKHLDAKFTRRMRNRGWYETART